MIDEKILDRIPRIMEPWNFVLGPRIIDYEEFIFLVRERRKRMNIFTSDQKGILEEVNQKLNLIRIERDVTYGDICEALGILDYEKMKDVVIYPKDNNSVIDEVYNLIWGIAKISPEHGNALMDILGDEKYEEVSLKSSYKSSMHYERQMTLKYLRGMPESDMLELWEEANAEAPGDDWDWED